MCHSSFRVEKCRLLLHIIQELFFVTQQQGTTVRAVCCQRVGTGAVFLICFCRHWSSLRDSARVMAQFQAGGELSVQGLVRATGPVGPVKMGTGCGVVGKRRVVAGFYRYVRIRFRVMV
jgi:hypothetical protein